MNLQLSAAIVNCGGANGLHVELLLQKFAFGLQILIPLSTPRKFQFGFAVDFMYVCRNSMFVCGSLL